MGHSSSSSSSSSSAGDYSGGWASDHTVPGATRGPVDPALDELHKRMIDSGSFSNAAEVLYQECKQLIDAGDTPRAKAIFLADHGMMPLYFLDDLASRISNELWQANDVEGFFEWAQLASTQHACVANVGARIQASLNGHDLHTAQKLCNFLPSSRRYSYQQAIDCGRVLLEIQAYSSTDIARVIAAARALPTYVQYDLLSRLYKRMNSIKRAGGTEADGTAQDDSAATEARLLSVVAAERAATNHFHLLAGSNRDLWLTPAQSKNLADWMRNAAPPEHRCAAVADKILSELEQNSSSNGEVGATRGGLNFQTFQTMWTQYRVDQASSGKGAAAGSTSARAPEFSVDNYLALALKRINETEFARSFADVLISVAVTPEEIRAAIENFRVHEPSPHALYLVLLGQAKNLARLAMPQERIDSWLDALYECFPDPTYVPSTSRKDQSSQAAKAHAAAEQSAAEQEKGRQQKLTPPEHFLCPITTDVMRHPMKTPFGHTFERHAILEWIKKCYTCPLTRMKLVAADLKLDEKLQAEIHAWQASVADEEANAPFMTFARSKEVKEQVQLAGVVGACLRSDFESARASIKLFPASHATAEKFLHIIRAIICNEAFGQQEEEEPLSPRTSLPIEQNENAFGASLALPAVVDEQNAATFLPATCSEAEKLELEAQRTAREDIKITQLENILELIEDTITRSERLLVVLGDVIKRGAYSHEELTPFLKLADPSLCPLVALRYLFYAYWGCNSADSPTKTTILQLGQKLLRNVPPHLIKSLRTDLEVEGGMSNDYHVFPWKDRPSQRSECD